MTPTVGAADDILDIGQSATESTQTVTDTVDQTSQTVTDTVDQTTQTVTDTVDQTTQTVTDAVDQTSQTVTDAVDQTSQTMNAAGNVLASDGAGGSGSLQGGTRESASTRSIDEGDSGSMGPGHWAARDRLRRPPSAVASDTSPFFTVMTDDNPDSELDPCHDDQRLVCLGLLFGLGDFAETGADVLGVLVRTGAVGVVVLAAIALLLAILGAAALAASSDRFSFAHNRVD